MTIDVAAPPATEPPPEAPAGLPWHQRHAWALPAGLVGLVVALPALGVFRAPGPPMEEGFMLVFPERLLEGDIPNKDFLHLYGPGSIWVIAALFKVFGVSLWVARVFGFVQLVGLVAGTTYIGHRWGRWPAVAGGAATAVIIIPPIGVTALAWVGGVALALWAVIAATDALDRARRPERALTVAGLLAGCALLFRPDLVVALGLSLGALFLFALDGTGRRRLLTGSLLGVSPFLVHMALAGPGNAFSGMVLEPVFDLRPGRKLPFPPPTDYFASFLNRAYALRDFPWPLPSPSMTLQVAIFFWVLAAVCLSLLVMAVRARRLGSPQAWRLVALALLACGLLPQAVQRSDSAHLSWVSCVPFGLLPAFVTESLRLRRARPGGRANAGETTRPDDPAEPTHATGGAEPTNATAGARAVASDDERAAEPAGTPGAAEGDESAVATLVAVDEAAAGGTAEGDAVAEGRGAPANGDGGTETTGTGDGDGGGDDGGSPEGAPGDAGSGDTGGRDARGREAGAPDGRQRVLAGAALLSPFVLMLLFPAYTYRWYADYVAQSFGSGREVSNIENRGRSFYYGRAAVADAAEELLADVEETTRPGDRLVVGPGDLAVTPYSEAFFYFLLPQLEPGTHYIEMDPGVANAEDSGLADELRRADVVILSTVYDDWDEPNTASHRGSEEPNEVLGEEFCLHDDYGSNRGFDGVDRPIYQLYLRCGPDGRGSGADADAG